MQAASEPILTVGVPVFNGERYLAQCLDSLLAQTFQDFVLLISDNASTDGTERICERYARRDARVRYHRHETNIGMYPNINFLLRSARTRYIKLANADDFWAPTMLAEALAAIERDPAVVLCYPRTVLVDANDAEIRRYERHLNLVDDDPVARFIRVITELGLVNQLTGLIRCDVLKRTLDLISQPPADKIFLAELSLYGKIVELPGYLYFRRFHEDASSWDRSSESHQLKRVAAAGTRRFPLATWKYYGALIRRVGRSPLRYGQKLTLFQFLAKYMAWDRSALLDECWQFLSSRRSNAS